MKIYVYNVKNNCEMTVYGTATECANDLQIRPSTITKKAHQNAWLATDYKFDLYFRTYLFSTRELTNDELSALKNMSSVKRRYNVPTESMSKKYYLYNQRDGEFIGEYTIPEMQKRFTMPAAIAIINSVDRFALKGYNIFVSTKKEKRLKDENCWRFDFITPDMLVRFSTYRPETLPKHLWADGDKNYVEKIVRVFIEPEQTKCFPNHTFDYENVYAYSVDNE